MLYKNGTFEKVVDQSTLTSDCWLIQIEGIGACNRCSCFNKRTGKPKKDCGGKRIREAILNK